MQMRFRGFILVMVVLLTRQISVSTVAQAAPPASDAIPLWDKGAPGAIGTEAADIPTLTPFIPARGIATAAAMVVCPGGGYQHLADHEGAPVAQWLNSIGVAAFVLKYRLGPRYHHPAPMLDAARAIRTVRARAAEWGINPAKIGILGFSAGGHVASTAGTHYDQGNASSPDPVERVSSRPDLMVLIYPVITMGGKAHAGSRRNLLGSGPEPSLVTLLSNEEQVNSQTPPAFLVHTVDDATVPVENSTMFAAALQRAKVPYELHLYQHGPHGFGLAEKNPGVSSWPGLCADWLRLNGFVVSANR
jgi:acetyl esterase/lipase